MTRIICNACDKHGRTVSQHVAFHRAHPSHLLAIIGAVIVIVAGAWLMGGGLGGGSW